MQTVLSSFSIKVFTIPQLFLTRQPFGLRIWMATVFEVRGPPGLFVADRSHNESVLHLVRKVCEVYRGTSLIRNRPPLESYGRPMPRALWRS